MKTSAILIVLILAFYNTVSGQVIDSVKFKSLPPDDFQKAFLKDEKAILIDVREFFEFRKSRLKGAINIPSSGNMEFAADTIDKECGLFLYCTTGFRSKRVAKRFCEKGFGKVYSLEGGIVGWKKERFPLDPSRRRKVASSLRSSQ
jgi:rhodanese-related sulfurtransferase